VLARSAAYDQAFINGANPVYRVDILRGFAIKKSGVKLASGEINIDIEAASRRTFRGILIDEDGSLQPSTPVRATDLVMPYGSELAIYMGFEGTELLPVGVFRIEETNRDGDAYEVDCRDRSIYVEAAKFERPYALRTGWLITEALRVLIGDRYPGLQFDVQTTSGARTEERPDVEILDEEGNVVDTIGDPTPIIVYQDGEQSGDPWTVAQKLAARFDLEVFMDPRGICVIRDAPRVAGAPIWTYEVGPDSVLLSGAGRWSSREAKNISLAMSEGAGVETPLKASATLTDPNHVLYPSAEFGRRPTFARGTYKDQARTQEIADSGLAAGIANHELLGFAGLAHPAFVEGDTVRVRIPETNTDHTALLASWNLDVLGQSESAFGTVTSRPGEEEEPPTP
jgi:hypothetical protein